jgi:hypothetical protein
MSEKKNAESVPLDPKCTRRGCNGTVYFADMGEVYDGERAHCDTCGRLHVAVAYEDCMRVHHDREQERKEKR